MRPDTLATSSKTTNIAGKLATWKNTGERDWRTATSRKQLRLRQARASVRSSGCSSAFRRLPWWLPLLAHWLPDYSLCWACVNQRRNDRRPVAPSSASRRGVRCRCVLHADRWTGAPRARRTITVAQTAGRRVAQCRLHRQRCSRVGRLSRLRYPADECDSQREGTSIPAHQGRSCSLKRSISAAHWTCIGFRMMGSYSKRTSSHTDRGSPSARPWPRSRNLSDANYSSPFGNSSARRSRDREQIVGDMCRLSLPLRTESLGRYVPGPGTFERDTRPCETRGRASRS